MSVRALVPSTRGKAVVAVTLLIGSAALPTVADAHPEDGAAASASRRAFGFRTTLGGQGLPLYSPVPGAAANAPSQFGSVGVAHFVTDAVTLLGDLGFGTVLAGGKARFGIGAQFGVDYHFRTRRDALRPLLHAQLSISRAPQNDLDNTGQDLPWLGVQAGPGAEYFFSRNFSLAARVGLGFAWRFGLGAPAPGGGVALVGTVTPALSAAWYF